MGTNYLGQWVPDEEVASETTQEVNSGEAQQTEPTHVTDRETAEVEAEDDQDDGDAANEDEPDEDGASRKLTPTEKRLAAAKALLAELETKAAEERREKARKAADAEAARDKRLAATRGAALKQLYVAKGIDPIPGDRFEKERFAALLKALKVKV